MPRRQRINIDVQDDIQQAVERILTTTVTTGVRKTKDPTTRYLRRIYRALRKTHGDRFPTSSGLFGRDQSNPDLARRSGRGLKSIRESINVRYNGRMGVEGRISTGTMGIHETGGTIEAQNSEYLAIPTRYAMTSRGQPRKKSPRNWTNTFARKTRNGNLFIFRNEGKGNIIPLYLLKRYVYIPARLRLRETADDLAPTYVAELDAALSRALKRRK